jgi:hypothetical protein
MTKHQDIMGKKFIVDVVGVLPVLLFTQRHNVDDCITHILEDIPYMSSDTLHHIRSDCSSNIIKKAALAELLWRSNAFQWKHCNVATSCNMCPDVNEPNIEYVADDFLPFGEDHDGLRIPKRLMRIQQKKKRTLYFDD